MKDIYTKQEIVESFEHYIVHDSQMYRASQYFTIAAAQVAEVMMVIGSQSAHIVFNVNTSGQGLCKFYEGITTSANGTTVTVFNMNRNSSNSCTCTFFHTPTWSTNTEKLLDISLIGVGNIANVRIGASERNGTEWVLKPSTKYLMRIENQAGSTITSSMRFEFYEKNAQ